MHLDICKLEVRRRHDEDWCTFVAELFLESLYFVRVVLVANAPGRHGVDGRVWGED